MLLRIERGSGTPIRAQLVRELRRAIRSGRMAAGTTLPATRVLAEELGVSRGVVVQAYEQLAAEGYLIPRHGSATRVAGLDTVPAASERNGNGRAPHVKYDFRPGVPDLSLFPARAWHRASQQALADFRRALDYPDPRGVEPARIALAGYLNRSRATVVRADALVMCTGFAQAARLVGEALFARGIRRLGVENPGHAEQCADIRATGLELVPLPVDDRGLRVDLLPGRDLRAVLVTPAHQYPTGAVLDAGRRVALLEWARRVEGVVLEDDYDAEYRYDRAPLGALQGMCPEHVVYFGTASKMLAPSLRQGWVALPPSIVDSVVSAKMSADRGSPALEQLTLAAFIDAGDLDRHVRRTRTIYRKRRDLLVEALRRHFPANSMKGVPAGLHLMLQLPAGADEDRIVATAESAGIRVYGARSYWLGPSEAPALLLGYGGLPDADIPAAVRALARVVGMAPASRRSPVPRVKR